MEESTYPQNLLAAVFAVIIPVAAATGASINPVRSVGPMPVAELFGGTAHWGKLPVHLAAECVGAVAAALAGKGVRIARSLVGNYITSLDMAGVSITVCKTDAAMLALWDAPVNTPALRWGM
ncbi:dihydroxyacetone kinase subunit DhaK [Wenjunlia tyrosinilytica]